jgi:glutaredoxin-like protein NrdH
MDITRYLQTHAIGSQTTSPPAALNLRRMIREPADQTRPHTPRRRCAKGPSTTRSPATIDNCQAQRLISSFGIGPHGQINNPGIEYTTIDISDDEQASDYVMSLRHLQAPVIYLSTSVHWSGFRPDRLAGLSDSAA